MNPNAIHSRLTMYLIDKDISVPPTYLSISEKANENNKKYPRSFCHVVLGRQSIYCAEALGALPEEFIIGILLHEIAHTIIVEGDDPELDVDEWILENVPEAGYEYANAKYVDPISGKKRVAKNIEKVSAKFLKKLLGA